MEKTYAEELVQTLGGTYPSEAEILPEAITRLNVGKIPLTLYKQIKEEFCPTEIKELDKALGGGLYEGLTIISGAPGVGKSALALNIALNASKRGTQALYINLDMSLYNMISRIEKQIFYTTKAYKDGLTLEKVYNERDLGPHKVDLEQKFQFYTQHLMILTQEMFSSGEVEGYILNLSFCEKAIENVASATQNPLVIIDYLQMLPNDTGLDDKRFLDMCIATFKRLAAKYHIPIILLSAANRRSNELNNNGLYASAGSGQIEYASRTYISISNLRECAKGEVDNSGKKVRRLQLNLLKNKEGESGISIPMNYYPAYNLFPYYEHKIRPEDLS